MSDPLRILVVAGHPADMFDHCGGTLLHHIRRGDTVTCVSLTKGLRVHDEVVSDLFRRHVDEYSPEEIDRILQERQKVKYAEVLEACGLFGIQDVRFLDYDDEILSVTPEMITRLAKVIRQVQPNLVITHWPYQSDMFSNHHAVTGQLTMAAITAASGVSFSDRDKPARIAQVAFMLCSEDVFPTSILGHGLQACATYFVDVSDCVELKVRAVNTMRSQKYDIRGYSKKTAELWNGNFGSKVGLPYAEGFVLNWPEVGECLPVSEHRLWLSQEDEGRILQRRSSLAAMDVDVPQRTL